MNYFLVYLKGIAMGAADVVPGVSGGTIAFITGIYDVLLLSLKRMTPQLISIWKEQGFIKVLQHINACFLFALAAGIFTSIFTLAKTVNWLLENHPIPLWSFFFGLIIVSASYIARQIKHKALFHYVFAFIGILMAYSITILQPIHLTPTWWNLLLTGAIASSAMILPGLSGSFILLLLGIYPVILEAVTLMDLNVLILFSIGVALGLLIFSHFLHWLLHHHRPHTLAFLVGLMLGSLPKIWPWKQTLTWSHNAKGESIALEQINLLPQHYAEATGEPSQMPLAILCLLFGIGIVLFMEYLAHRQQTAATRKKTHTDPHT